MPLTPDMRRAIEQIRDYLFGGGYPDPVSNAEQLSFLFFFYLVEGIDAENQFRTPRHIIRAMVEIADPKIGETVYDPAAGTAGFLVAAYNHIRLANSLPNGIRRAELDGKTITRGLGDQLSAAQVSALQSKTF